MTQTFAKFSLMAGAALCLFLSACDEGGTKADTTTAQQSISAVNAAAYATAQGAANGAIFLTLRNAGTADDALIAAKSDKAKHVEIHESAVDETTGTMKMRKIDTLEIKAGEETKLVPGGYHIMLMGLDAPLAEGGTFDLTLDFEKAPDLVVPVGIIAPGAYGSRAPAHE